jgi:MFS family permease
VGDWLVKHDGLLNARRLIGFAGQGSAALFFAAAFYSPGGKRALVFLSLAYGGILFQQPTFGALCLDVGRKNAGAVFGFMNTAGSAASVISSAVFGTIVGRFGSYNMPFVPMVAFLCLGALLWLKVDPTRELFPEVLPPKSAVDPTVARRYD